MEAHMAKRRILRTLLFALGFVVAIEAFDMLFTTLAVRSRNPRALRLVKRLHKLTNPLVVRFSGRPGGDLATVHHIGRRSGTSYATPVIAHRSGHDVVIPLPYGTEVDWLRNLMAMGAGVMDLDGATFPIDHPSLVEIDEVVETLPPSMANIVRSHRTRDAVRMHVSETTAAESP